MRTVQTDEVLGLAAYEAVRDSFRARMIAHKKQRRVFLGPEMSLVFEDHDSVLLQVQEILRTERISDPVAVREEVASCNDLVPPDGALLATLMIETVDEAGREAKRRTLVGLDQAIELVLGTRRIRAVFAPEGLYPDRIAVVQYLRFDLDDEGAAALVDLAVPARIECTHPAYAHSVVLPEATRRALARDLDPANRRVHAKG